jgi:hypothetical protein
VIRRPSTLTRGKEAAVLYDEVIFEAGVYDYSATDEGSFEHYRPPGGFTPEDLAETRIIPEPRTGMQVSLAFEAEPGEPAPPEELRSFISGTLSAYYVAEFETGILEELRKLDVPWAAAFVAQDDQLRENGLDQIIRDYAHERQRDESWSDPDSRILRTFVAKAFARDAVVASSLGAAFNITSLFQPLLESSSTRPVLVGQRALAVLVPNVRDLRWEEIAEFREHPGSVEARAKLAEAEQRVAASEPDDPLEFQQRLYSAISDDLFAAIKETQGKDSTTVGKEVAKTAIGFIPVVGPIAGTAASAADLVWKERTERRHWTAALMKLRDRA